MELKRRRISPFLLASFLGLVWVVFLAALAVTTANPVILNRYQAARADLIVTAVCSDPSQNVVQVEKEWKAGQTPGTLTVDGLQEHGLRPDTLYLLPLSRQTDDHFVVTRTTMSPDRGTVYRATPDVLRQLEQVLAELAQQRASMQTLVRPTRERTTHSTNRSEKTSASIK